MPAEGHRGNGHPEAYAVVERLLEIDPLRTTPMEALLLLAELKKLAKGAGK